MELGEKMLVRTVYNTLAINTLELVIYVKECKSGGNIKTDHAPQNQYFLKRILTLRQIIETK